MTNDGFHPPVEQYLEALYDMEEEGVAPIQARLADRLGHTAPSVSEMVKRLERDGYLTINKRNLELSKEGRRIAESVVRKHRLAERLLVDVIGLDWELAHDEACRWEHVISDTVEARLVAMLADSTTCPHGNPIPGLAKQESQMWPISEMKLNSSGEIKRVTEWIEVNFDRLSFAARNNLKPGSKLIVEKVNNNSSVEVKVEGKAVEVPWDLASAIYCEVT